MTGRILRIGLWAVSTALCALYAFWPWGPVTPIALHAQGAPQTLTSTTLAGAQSLTATTVNLTTATGFAQAGGSIAVPSNTQGAFLVYVDREAERVIAATGSGTIWTVQRGWGGTAATPHASGRRVWFGLEGQFQNSDPPWGSCTSPVFIVPWINLQSGNVWLCRSSLWQATNVMNITYASTTSQTSINP